jgi:DNA-binding transcriptional MerR regulator/methylmalonyl-CoA mutase cobalamin-binding subunit
MHPIKFVAQQTGLSPHVIRMWERRYAVVAPQRTPTNRRLYSDSDIERLSLLQRAIQAGHNISQLSKLPAERLREIGGTVGPVGGLAGRAAELPLAECVAAVQDLDGRRLERLLSDAALRHSQTAIMEKLIVPLMEQIGEQWSSGTLRPAHEHLATAIVRSFLANLSGAYRNPDHAPRLVVTTPAGQWHELGALLVTTTAAAAGWQVSYLGPNLPAEEIAGAAAQNQAHAIALSVVYPGDDPQVAHELRRLRQLVPASVAILLGGRSASRYAPLAEEIGLQRIQDLAQLRAQLHALRE